MSDNFNQNKLDGKDEWLTPPEIIRAFPEFDLDPCAPVNRPWNTAKNNYTILDNGLAKDWSGCVWLNPPYGNETGKWMQKLSEHGNGIALTFARTETKMFKSFIWERADAILFIYGRLRFYHVSGQIAKSSGGAPSCLIAYGEEAKSRLKNSVIKGFFIELNNGSGK